MSTAAAGITSPALSISPNVPNNTYDAANSTSDGDSQPMNAIDSVVTGANNESHSNSADVCNKVTAPKDGDCTNIVTDTESHNTTDVIAQTSTTTTNNSSTTDSKNVNSTAVKNCSSAKTTSPSASESKVSNNSCDKNSKNCRLFYYSE